MERTVRILGVVLMVAGLALGEAAPPLLEAAGATDFGLWVLAMDVARAVVLPLGAGLVAASLVLRALVSGVSPSSVRTQLVAAVVLVGVGLLARAWGASAAYELEQYLGPSGRAGALLVAAVDSIVAAGAVPLGVALAAVWPVQRWLAHPSSVSGE